MIDALADWLAGTHAATGLRNDGPRALVVDLERVRLRITLHPPTIGAAAYSGRHAALRYQLGGQPDPADAERARTILHAVIADLARLDLDTTRSPAALIDDVDAAHRALCDRNDQLPPLALPPCLDLAMRPAPPIADAAPLPSLPAPCNACGARTACPAARRGVEGPQADLRPLRHTDPQAAALAAVRAIAEPFGGSPEGERFIAALYGSRDGELAAPHAPVELSLKRVGDRLAPLLRIVEYPQPATRGPLSRPERSGRWRRRLLELGGPLLDGASQARLAEFASLLESTQGAAVELSLGIELDLTSGARRVQLYGHLEPRDRRRMTEALTRALAWVQTSAGPVVELLNRRPADILLLAATFATDAPPEAKAYFALPLDATDARTGLAPVELGGWRDFAPQRGLAVLSAAAGQPARFVKWDFPCAPHYQRAAALGETFAAGLSGNDTAHVRRILDGRSFVAWPTWISLRPGANTIYFVPR